MKKIAVLGAALLASGCASFNAQEPDPVELKLQSLMQQVDTLQRELSDQKRVVQGMSAVGLGNSVAVLEDQVRLLRGRVEQLEYEAEQRSERQKTLYVDLDNRLRALEDGTKSAGAAKAPALPAAGGADQAVYLNAFQTLKSGDYDAAIERFNAFLQQFPDSSYAANAQYWIGEAHYVTRDFDAAWAAFTKVREAYPDSGKAADALLKQALVRVEQGRASDARGLFKQVVSDYPNTATATQAQERLKSLQ